MHNGNKIIHACTSGICVIAGNVLYALTARLFLIPSGLITGGTTGIALAALASSEREMHKGARIPSDRFRGVLRHEKSPMGTRVPQRAKYGLKTP